MADSRNNNSKSNNSKNIPLKNRSSSNGTVSQRTNYKSQSGGKRKSKVEVKEKSSNHKEIVAVIILAVCVFLIVSMFGKAGFIGNFITDVFYGFFGLFGTLVLVIIAVVYGVCILRGSEKTVFKVKRCVLLGGLFLCGSALFHTMSSVYYDFTKHSEDIFQFISSLWTSVDKSFLGGGLVGGLLSSLLQWAVSTVGTYVILIPAAFVFAMLVFSFSILPFYKRLEGVAKKGWSGVKGVAGRIKEKSADKVKNKANNKNHKKTTNPKKVDSENDTDVFLPGDYEDYNDDIVVSGIDDNNFFDDYDNDGGVIEPASDVAENVITYSGAGHDDFDEEGVVPTEFEDIPMPVAEKIDQASEDDEGTVSGPSDDENGTEEIEEEPVPAKKSPVEASDMPVLSHGEYDDYIYPSEELLNIDSSGKRSPVAERAAATAVAKKLEDVLRSFSIEAKVTHVSIGPTVTRYELLPSTGVRVNKIKNLSDDIALNLAAQSIRIEAPIPGKAAIGIEIPNTDMRPVYLREIIQSATFKSNRSKIAFCLGSDISGTPIVGDLEKMPHMLIAGTTGSGKSVCTNCLITSFLYKASPDEVRLILVDPKIVEFSKYNGIPHLLLPVVTEPKKAAAALAWSVSEMEKRYRLFAAHGVRDISSYNTFAEANGYGKMPRIVIIIDELADLMMVARDSVETAINRIAQKARAAGMHLVIATQRPSVDVITGLIKSNVPSRIALKVASPVDSRIILDSTGAEKLLGRGDMLFYPVGSMKTTRIQGAFVSDEEIERLVDFIKNNGDGDDAYIDEIIESVNNASENHDVSLGQAGGDSDEDPLFREAVKIAIQEKQISASYLQRMLKIGYNRAARMVDLMEEKGIVSCRDGSNPRKVLVDHYDGE